MRVQLIRYSLTISIFLFCQTIFCQTIEKARVDPPPGTTCFGFYPLDKKPSEGGVTKPRTQKKVIAIYIITYSENNCHTKEPRLVFQEEGVSRDELRSIVRDNETDPNYKFNTINYIGLEKPFGVLYSKNCKNGDRKYLLGTYTTLEAAQKRCNELDSSRSSSNYKCENIISLNDV